MAITPRPYIVNPFGIDGDGDIVPNTGMGDTGDVNYQYGFTPNYALPNSDPTSLPVPRTSTNQILCDISNGLQAIQNQGFPTWTPYNPTDPIGGYSGPSSYGVGVWVWYNGSVWVSQVASNTSTPGADNNWVQVNNNAQGVAAGTVIIFGGPVPPVGYFATDGTAYSRVTYPALFNALTMTQSVTLTSTMNTFTVTNGPTFPVSQLYIGMPVEGTGIPASTTITNVVGTTVTISNAATISGASTLRFFSWMNGDGSTTFNVPNYNGKVPMGSGGTPVAGVIGSSTGQTGGEAAHTLTIPEMPNHDHNGSTIPFGRVNTQVPYQGSSPPIYPVNASSSAVTVNPQGGGGAHNNIQPSNVSTFCIKY